MTAIRRAGAWFGWSPADIMALPYEDFVALMLAETEERRERRHKAWPLWVKA
ncbi:hypothetical protein AVA06_003448 [Salmonella enterica subsp. enterica]|nr:hypothetical protein [Salmonella enterica subsp. enterica]EED9675468.1 hypothetical protein [Salmonella enterica subsp. enterica]